MGSDMSGLLPAVATVVVRGIVDALFVASHGAGFVFFFFEVSRVNCSEFFVRKFDAPIFWYRKEGCFDEDQSLNFFGKLQV